MAQGTREEGRKLADSQAVPVLPSPRIRTFMGTVRLHVRRSMSVSAVKMSVDGLGEYRVECVMIGRVGGPSLSLSLCLCCAGLGYAVLGRTSDQASEYRVLATAQRRNTKIWGKDGVLGKWTRTTRP